MPPSLALEVRHRPSSEVPEEEWAAVPSTAHPAPPPPGLEAFLVFQNAKPVARLAAGVAEDMGRAPGRTGYIGWYEAQNEEAGVLALRSACAWLRAHFVERIVGPLNGSTWNRYRLALAPSDSRTAPPPFLGEPTNPFTYPAHFRRAGFHPQWRYESRIVSTPRVPFTRQEENSLRLDRFGVTIRPLNLQAYERDQRAIHALSLEAFASNWFYTPLQEQEFFKLYEPLRPLLDPSLVLLAEDAQGALMGYAFAYPDPFSSGARPRLVLKTLAAARQARRMGIGRALTDRVHQLAQEREMEVVHALMESSNVSTSLSAQHPAAPFREYALYQFLDP